MRTYTIKPQRGVPDWENIEKAPIDTPLWLEPPAGISAAAQLCYDAEALKVRLTAVERDILSRFEGPLDPVCADSCLEFFFCPAPNDSRYFNFEFNPRGALCLGFGPDRNHSIRQVIGDYRSLFSVRPFVFEGGWGIDFAVPASFIGIYIPSFKLEAGLNLRGNFYKCGDATKTPHYIVWNPIDWDRPDFHRPMDFGGLVLGA
jgi:hypothetical protein